MRELDSQPQVKRLLKNLDNSELHTREAVIEQQAHLINFKKSWIDHSEGIRSIVLKRNKFGDGFAPVLQKFLQSEKYLKAIDLSGNKFTQYGLELILKLGLLEN